MTEVISAVVDDSKFVYHILRYTSDLVRDEWVNIGVQLFDPLTGALRLRLVEEQDEYARIRRLQPSADEDVFVASATISKTGLLPFCEIGRVSRAGRWPVERNSRDSSRI